MNNHLDLEKLGLGIPQPISSKLFPTINIQKEPPKLASLIIIEKPKEEVVVTDIYVKKEIIYLKPPIVFSCEPCKNEDSIIDLIDTGFGCDNTLVKDCPKPEYKTHLCRENYLSEFKTETEKLLARTNLGVYSKEEINDIIAKIVEDNNRQFITLGEVESMLSNLDFVNSALKSATDYEIPNDLFTL